MTRQTIALSVTADLYKALCEIAAERGISVHEAARVAVEIGVKQLRIPPQMTFGERGGR